MAQLVTLERWAESVFGEARPCTETLRRWARGGRIFPAATKVGRAYFVRPDAQYVDPLAPRVDNMSPGGVRLSSPLARRLFGATPTRRRQPAPAAQPVPPS